MADQNAITYWIWMNRLILFLTVLDISNDESVNSTLRNKKNGATQMTDWKLNLHIKLGVIRYLRLPDIIDYKLVHDSEIQNNGSNILDEIHQYTEVFAVADLETRHVTIP